MSESESPSAKRAKVDEEASATEPREEEEESPPLPPVPAKGNPLMAMLWYYCDKDGKRQGPFYPGQMRQWWSAGFFAPSQLVAPS